MEIPKAIGQFAAPSLLKPLFAPYFRWATTERTTM